MTSSLVDLTYNRVMHLSCEPESFEFGISFKRQQPYHIFVPLEKGEIVAEVLRQRKCCELTQQFPETFAGYQQAGMGIFLPVSD